MDGYKGIWYSSGPKMEYGYKFSGGVSTFASRHRPIAIYSPEVKKTFFVYGGTTNSDAQHLLIMISYFDHRSHTVPKPVVVYDKMGVKEPYDNASLSIDNGGFVWVFVSGNNRTRPGLIFKSTKPYSIENFELIREMEMMSPQPWSIGNSGFLLMYSKFSKGMDIWYATTSDGKTWANEKKLASMGGHLQISRMNKGKIVTAFTYFPEGDIDRQTNLYLIESTDNGLNWTNIEGQTLNTPLTETDNTALVRNYESEGRLVFLSDLNFDSEGNPVMLVILSKSSEPGPEGGPRDWVVISRKENKWNFTKVCESTHNFDRGFIDSSGDLWRIVGPTEPGPRKYGTGGEIATWTSADKGQSWQKIMDVTKNSANNNSFVRRPVNAHDVFYALWTDGNTDELSKSYLYFTNAKCDKVWVLPYEMKDNFQKPVRIR